MFKNKNKFSLTLMAAIFATGFSGIVAEYLLSTLATYFLGDSILQWTMIVSTMMFSMGLGSRLSKQFKDNLMQRFLVLEFILSVLVALAPLLVYTAASYTSSLAAIIYGFSIAIGVLIGMEIPLVTRINEVHEELRVNISNVLEKDYYGSLLGGVFFAFVGIPFLGLTYTPFVLGFVNLLVAIFVFIQFKKRFNLPAGFGLSSIGIVVLLLGVLFFAEPIIQYGEQVRYKDKVIYSTQSSYQRIVITEWKNDHWLYLNGNQQLSTVDEVLYHEPLVHPAMQLHPNAKNVLVLGGGDGCAVREILKHKEVEHVQLVDLDPAVTQLAKENSILVELNDSSLYHPKVKVLNTDGYKYIQSNRDYYDVIIIDLPDPRTVELGRLYSYEFYKLCYQHLRPGGILVTQAGSPYFANDAFRCIEKTMAAAGFQTVPLHNHVLTLGEWGWCLGVKWQEEVNVKSNLQKLTFEPINVQWINNEAMQLITSFGKSYLSASGDSVVVNRIHQPVLYKYYLNGKWDLF